MRQAEDHKVRYVRGKVSEIERDPQTGKLVLRYENTNKGELEEKQFDMAVLSLAMEPAKGTKKLVKTIRGDYYRVLMLAPTQLSNLLPLDFLTPKSITNIKITLNKKNPKAKPFQTKEPVFLPSNSFRKLN